jgi:hypothetical protein
VYNKIVAVVVGSEFFRSVVLYVQASSSFIFPKWTVFLCLDRVVYRSPHMVYVFHVIFKIFSGYSTRHSHPAGAGSSDAVEEVEVEATGFSETLVSISPTTRRYILQDRSCYVQYL